MFIEKVSFGFVILISSSLFLNSSVDASDFLLINGSEFSAEFYDGPGDRKKRKVNKYKKTGGLLSFGNRQKPAKGRTSAFSTGDNGGNQKLKGGGFNFKRKNNYKNNRKSIGRTFRYRKGNSYKNKWVRKYRQRRYFHHDRTGRRGNSFQY